MHFIYSAIIATFFALPLQAQQQTKLHDVAIVVGSFDKYEPLWKPFFHFLHKNWPGLSTDNKNLPIYLLSNTKIFHDPHQRVQMALNPHEKSWSESMIKALEKVKESYVLILLDDYILSNPVDEERLAAVFTEMKKLDAPYLQISCFDIGLHGGPAPCGSKDLVAREKNCLYRASLQAAFWKRDALLAILKDTESAWEFEVKGGERSNDYPGDFLGIKTQQPLSYYNAMNENVLMNDVEEVILKDLPDFTHSFKRYNDLGVTITRLRKQYGRTLRAWFRQYIRTPLSQTYAIIQDRF